MKIVAGENVGRMVRESMKNRCAVDSARFVGVFMSHIKLFNWLDFRVCIIKEKESGKKYLPFQEAVDHPLKVVATVIYLGI